MHWTFISRKKKIILITATVLLVVALILAVIMNSEDMESEKHGSEGAGTVRQALPGESETLTARPVPVQEKQEASLKQQVKNFMERYGTYSNHAGFAGLYELEPMMNSKMRDWFYNSYLPKLRQDHPIDGFYYSVSTMAPSIELLREEEGLKVYKVSTQRTEMIQKNEDTFIQDAELTMVEQSGTWLVDGVFWQGKR